MPDRTKLLYVLCMLLMAVPALFAGTSAQWDVSLQSSGTDVSWNSPDKVRPGYENYYYECDFTAVEVELDLSGSTMWMDYSPAFSPSSASLLNGVEAQVVNTVYDANEMTFTMAVNIDADGYAHASLTNVAFPEPWAGYNLLGVKFDFTLKIFAVQTTWEDSFDYTTAGFIGGTANWTTKAWDGNPDYRGIKVGGTYAGVAHCTDGYYGSYPDEFYGVVKYALPAVDVYNGEAATGDYIARMTVSDGNMGDASNWYLLGRVDETNYSDPNYIKVTVGRDGTGTRLVFGLDDTNGDGYKVDDGTGTMVLSFIDVTDFVVGQPIDVVLKLQGSNAVASVSHNGVTASASFTTALSIVGDPAFGYDWKWGYTGADFEDFKVYSLTAADPQACGDDGTYYLKADMNNDCQVDADDLKMIAANWLVSIE